MPQEPFQLLSDIISELSAAHIRCVAITVLLFDAICFLTFLPSRKSLCVLFMLLVLLVIGYYYYYIYIYTLTF